MAKKTKPKKAQNPAREDVMQPSASQFKWLERGLSQAGGKLPLFDENGKRVSDRTVRSCVNNGWAEPWFENPIKPEWQICKLTETGRKIITH